MFNVLTSTAVSIANWLIFNNPPVCDASRETNLENDLLTKQREILELKMLAIIKLLPKGYSYYKKVLKIASSSKYFNLVFKEEEVGI